MPFIFKFVTIKKKVYGGFLAVTFLTVWLCLCVKFTFVVIQKTMARFNQTIFEAPFLVVKERCRALCLRLSDVKLGIKILYIFDLVFCHLRPHFCSVSFLLTFFFSSLVAVISHGKCLAFFAHFCQAVSNFIFTHSLLTWAVNHFN